MRAEGVLAILYARPSLLRGQQPIDHPCYIPRPSLLRGQQLPVRHPPLPAARRARRALELSARHICIDIWLYYTNQSTTHVMMIYHKHMYFNNHSFAQRSGPRPR